MAKKKVLMSGIILEALSKKHHCFNDCFSVITYFIWNTWTLTGFSIKKALMLKHSWIKSCEIASRYKVRCDLKKFLKLQINLLKYWSLDFYRAWILSILNSFEIEFLEHVIQAWCFFFLKTISFSMSFKDLLIGMPSSRNLFLCTYCVSKVLFDMAAAFTGLLSF